MASINDQNFGTDSEDDDFNPAPQVDSEDEVRVPKRQLKKKAERSRSRRESSGGSDAEDEDGDRNDNHQNGNKVDDEDEEDENEDRDDEDEDEEDDEDDEEDDDDDVRPRKRYKRIAGAQFIDQEAEVTEEEDEDEQEEDEEPGEDMHPEDLSRVADEHDDRKHRLLDQKRQRAEDIDAEKQAELLRQRYGRQRITATEVSTVPQHLLLPSVKDPSIYAVKCKPGKEHEVVMSILKRIAEQQDNSLAGVTSVFARERAMSGYIYVEAERKPDVTKATEDIIFCYANQMTLIPVNEMPDLLRVKKPKEIKEGSFVRMRRPPRYAGDLAQVLSVELNNSEVTVKLIPRIEYGDEENGAAAAKRKRPGGALYRPPQRMFNEHEARKKAMGRLQAGAQGVFYLQNEEYEHGFLIKTVKTNYIDTENVNPTLEEATKFSSAGEDGEELDLNALAASLRQTVSSGDYIPGDMIEVFQGEQQGLRGKTLTVHSDILSLEVSEGPLKGEKVEAPIKTLRKLFTEGDNVKVLSGSKYNGETGMVLIVRGDIVTILTDSNNEQIKVFSKDLRVAVDSGVTVGNSKYSLFDIVQLDATRVGCVIKVDRETVRVLDQENNVRTILPSSISAKLDKKRQTVATDRNGTQIQVEDSVREHGGSQRRGEIIGIHRNYLFIKDRLIHQNLGVWATRSGNVEISSAKGARPTDNALDLSRMNPSLMRQAPNGSMGPPQVRNAGGRDRLEGKIVLISKGDYKGMVGRVKSATANSVSVELEGRVSKFPTSFPKDILKLKDEATGNFYPIGAGGRRVPGGGASSGGSSSSQGFSSSLPSRTPLGSRTPMGASGGRTPAWGMGDGGRTPAWKMGGAGVSATSNYSSGGYGDGARTPAWGQSSSRTPAWQPDYGGSRTVVHNSDGNRTAYGGNDYSSGSKTPAYYGGSAPTPGATGTSAYSSRQPAYSKGAPTPGAMDAPTPGAYLGAPTPAAYDAPTPKAPYGGAYGTPAASAPTPGAAFAETPAAFTAETPAAFGGDDDDDDGPRYD